MVKKTNLKLCPFHNCLTCSCYDWLLISEDDWNTRPIEDDLRNRIAELEAHIDQLLEAGRKVSDAYERRYDSYSRETLEWEVLVSRLNDIAKWKEVTE